MSNDAGCYLLVKESKASARGRFNFPAGRPEQGETLIEATVREAHEETGLEVTVDHLVGIYRCPRTSEAFRVVNFVFFSEVRGGVLRRSNAHPVVRYFSPEEIAEMVSSRIIRGRHIHAAIADHEAGRHLPGHADSGGVEGGAPRPGRLNIESARSVTAVCLGPAAESGHVGRSPPSFEGWEALPFARLG